MRQPAAFGLLVSVLIWSSMPTALAQTRIPSIDILGQMLGAARGCGDQKAVPALSSCLLRYSDRQKTPAAVRKSLIAAAEKARKSPWLERSGVRQRAQTAVRAMILWKGLCKDLGRRPIDQPRAATFAARAAPLIPTRRSLY